MSGAGSVKNKTKESLVLQYVRSSYCSGHSCQPAVLFEIDGSSSNPAASVRCNKCEGATTGHSSGCTARSTPRQSNWASVYKLPQSFTGGGGVDA